MLLKEEHSLKAMLCRLDGTHSVRQEPMPMMVPYDLGYLWVMVG